VRLQQLLGRAATLPDLPLARRTHPRVHLLTGLPLAAGGDVGDGELAPLAPTPVPTTYQRYAIDQLQRVLPLQCAM
jgi:hypothetical protein